MSDELDRLRAELDEATDDVTRLRKKWAATAHQLVEAYAETELTKAERQFLTFALDEAADVMASRDGFTDDDHAALDTFRRMATPPTAEEPHVCEHPDRCLPECRGAADECCTPATPEEPAR